jgi:hypothetical protein
MPKLAELPWRTEEGTEEKEQDDSGNMIPVWRDERKEATFASASTLLVQAAAELCDGHFQRTVVAVVEQINAAHPAGVDAIIHQPAPSKKFARMINKWHGDHALEAQPRSACNIDTARCGLVCPPELAVTLWKALEAALGDMLRCKNAFCSSPEDAARAYGYRAVLTNHGMDFTGVVSHGGVAARVRQLAGEKFKHAGKDQYGGAYVAGGRGRGAGTHHPDYFHKTACDLVASWLETNHGSTGVGLVCETQLILPEYLKGRKKSHWPYKLVRAESPKELANDMSNM